MKFLFLTDSHWTDIRPKNRIDDIMESQFAELGEIIEICHENNIDQILHGGDTFNTRKPSHGLIVHLLDWCKQLNLPIFTVIGNHDEIGYNLDSVRNSGLGILLESGAFNTFEKLVFENEKVVIKPVHCSLDFQQSYMFPKEYDGWTKIILSHNYIIPSDTMPFDFIHPRDIQTNANLVLCGHYHLPFDYLGENGTRWINPGAISRWSLSERDRTPQVLIITINGGKLDVEYIKLKSSKPGSEIFDVNAVEIQRQQDRNIDQFAKSLESTTFLDIDIEQVVRTAGKEQNIDEEILNVILSKLRDAKEILK
jgi:exonuclease SbcD